MNHASQSVLETAEPVRRIVPNSRAGLRQRIDLLKREDRVLIELAMNPDLTRRRIAALVGLKPGTVTRRINKLAARLHDATVLRLLDARCPLSPEQRQIGVEHFLTGLSARQLSDKHQMPVAQVYRVIDYVRGWSRGLGMFRSSQEE